MNSDDLSPLRVLRTVSFYSLFVFALGQMGCGSNGNEALIDGQSVELIPEDDLNEIGGAEKELTIPPAGAPFKHVGNFRFESRAGGFAQFENNALYVRPSSSTNQLFALYEMPDARLQWCQIDTLKTNGTYNVKDSRGKLITSSRMTYANCLEKKEASNTSKFGIYALALQQTYPTQGADRATAGQFAWDGTRIRHPKLGRVIAKRGDHAVFLTPSETIDEEWKRHSTGGGGDAGVIGCNECGSIDAIKADMGLNEMPLLNVTKQAGWAKKAVIDMGNAPRGDATPSYWQPQNQSYKSSAPWLAITPWWVIFPGVEHAAVNTRVEVYDAKLYFLKKSTQTWVTVGLDGFGQWAKYMDFALNSSANLGSAQSRFENGGHRSYMLGPAYEPIHGGYSGFNMSNYGVQPNDIAAVVMQMKTRLVLNNPAGVDDRSKAKILVQVGADYYPTVGTTVKHYTPMTYAPAAASSRFGLVGNAERSHFFATIDPPGDNDTGSAYVAAGNSVALPLAKFEANMPPIE